MRYTLAIRLAFIGLALTACNQQQDSVAPGADWVLTNGRIYTVDEYPTALKSRTLAVVW